MANLLLIGGAGYTGRQILDAWLDQPSSQVTVLDNGTGVGGMSRLSEFQNDPRMQIIRDDARDRMRLDDLLRYEAFDHVVQLATGAAGKMDRSDVLDSMARGTQILIESIAQHCALTPVTQVVSTAPWGSQIDRAVNHGVSIRPASLLGVAEAVSMDVALGLGRELGVQTRVLVAPLSFGPHQLEGPVAQVIASILSGQGYPKTLSKSHWRMIYGPDLGQRVVRFLTQPTEGSVIRLPGLHETSWKQLTLMIEQLLERFVQTNPALKTRFPEASWTRRLSDQEAHHPGWPEIVMSGQGAIEKPETAWPKALADTLRWYLTEPNLWESRISVPKSPALIN